MVLNNPLIRPAISWGNRGIGGGTLDSHEGRWFPNFTCKLFFQTIRYSNSNKTPNSHGFSCWRWMIARWWFKIFFFNPIWGWFRFWRSYFLNWVAQPPPRFEFEMPQFFQKKTLHMKHGSWVPRCMLRCYRCGISGYQQLRVRIPPVRSYHHGWPTQPIYTRWAPTSYKWSFGAPLNGIING